MSKPRYQMTAQVLKAQMALPEPFPQASLSSLAVGWITNIIFG